MVSKKIQSKKFWYFCAAFCLAITLSNYSCTRNESKKPEPVKIGALLALTGENASHGISEQRGMDLALEEINSTGGIIEHPLNIIYGDSKMETERAFAEYRRLVSAHKVPIILGVTGSGVALSLAQIASNDRVVLLSDIDTSPALSTQGGSYFFRVIPSDDYSSKFLVKWTHEKGWKKAALIYNSQNAWSTGCKQAIETAFVKDGGNIQDPISVTDQTINFKSFISTLKTGNPDVYFVTLMGRQAGLFVKQCAEKNVFGPFLGTDNFSQDEFVTNAGEFAEKAYFAMPADNQSDKLKALQTKYYKKYNQTLESISINAYDSVMLVAHILKSLINENKPITGESIRNKLLSAKYSGLIGEIEFEANGDLKTANFRMYTYKGTNVVPLVE